MKLLSSHQTKKGLTRKDVLVSILLPIFILAFLFATFLPAAHRRSSRIVCVSNLKQISMSLRAWEDDGNSETNSMPKHIPIGPNNGQLAWVDAMGFSNVLQSAKILRCPQDTEKPPTNPDFPVRISYFLNLDADETYPQLILAGDDNLALADGIHPRPSQGSAEGDVPVEQGILEVATNTTVVWTGTRHHFVGNISFADGSVAEESTSGLISAFQYNFNGTPATTNRLAIP